MLDRNPGRKNPNRIIPASIDTGPNYEQAQRGIIKGQQKCVVTPEGQELKVHGSKVDGRTFIDADHSMAFAPAYERAQNRRKLAEAAEIGKLFGEEAARRYLTLD